MITPLKNKTKQSINLDSLILPKFYLALAYLSLAMLSYLPEKLKMSSRLDLLNFRFCISMLKAHCVSNTRRTKNKNIQDKLSSTPITILGC